MIFYSWDEIKKHGDCVEYLRGLNIPIVQEAHGKPIRFKFPPWRPSSDSGGFCVTKDWWRDHAKGESGSIIDLVARTEFNGDLFKASEKLGKELNINPTQEKLVEKDKIVKVYQYIDLDGNVIHETVRFEPKKFLQRRPDKVNPEEYIWNLQDITPILYRLKDWIKSSWVCVVGGEKDVDNLLELGIPATTNPMGEGNWNRVFNKSFKKKRAVIIPDNDETGRKHAQTVAKNIKDIATEIKIVELQDLAEKGDVSDWIEAKREKLENTQIQSELFSIIKEADIWEEITQEKLIDTYNETEQTLKEKAKEYNLIPFSNYRIGENETSTGKKKKKEPVQINELVKEVFIRFCGFPKTLGNNVLFDHDMKTDEIRYLTTPVELFSWIQEKSNNIIKWGRLEGAVSQEQLFHAVKSQAKKYEMISSSPSFPVREDVYYTFREMPQPTKDSYYFNKFIEFFCPASKTDKTLLRAFVASPLYYRPKSDRPLWIIDSCAGQGVGKTKLAEMVAYLYGSEDAEASEPFWFNVKELNDAGGDRCERRLLSHSGRKKRMVIVDNVTGYFKSQRIVQWVTQGSLSGLPPYGKGEETRPNDLTYVITANSATVDRDLVTRSFYIELNKPKATSKNWEAELQTFIHENRLKILSDIQGTLKKGMPEDIKSNYQRRTRFDGWEREVLVPICGNMDKYSDVFKLNKQRQHASDGEAEEADTIREAFIERLEALGIDPTQEPVWIQTPVLINWTQQAIPGFGGSTGRGVSHILRNFAKAQMISELGIEPKIFPHSGKNRKRGMMWNIDKYNEYKASKAMASIQFVKIITVNGVLN